VQLAIDHRRAARLVERGGALEAEDLDRQELGRGAFNQTRILV
jgi:hypothetical protein